MNFNLEKERAILLSDFGYKLYLQSRYEDSAKIGGVLSSAHTFLNTAISCWLTGVDEGGVIMAKKARDWLLRYFQENRDGPSSNLVRNYFEMTLAQWLLADEEDQQIVGRAVAGLGVYSKQLPRNKVSLAEVLTECAYFQAYDTLLAIAAESGHKIDCPKKRAPRTEIQMAIDIARSMMGVEPAAMARVRQDIDLFLSRNACFWLENGWAIRVATWAKIRFSNLQTSPDSPKDALLHCLKLS